MKNKEPKLDDLIGLSEHIQYLKNEIDYVAKKITKLDMAVLITGPSGTGKELIANAIAERNKLKIVPVNCGAIASELFESEMFGHKKGSFTNALYDKKGFVEEAKNGILFLDEIGDLPLHHQAKFLRFLQDKKFQRVGENIPRFINNITIIAATNKDLTIEINEGRFRKDLFYRLNHHIIQTIPLKERRIDIICLVNHFVHKTGVTIDPKVKFLFYSYDFPGNVRELESLIYSSDNFEYVRTALRRIIASSIGIDIEFILQFKSLHDFDGKIKMEYIMALNERESKGKSIGEDNERDMLSSLDKLRRNKEVNEFIRASFFAGENDCSKMVEAYEIMTLKLCPGLTNEAIQRILPLRDNKVYPKIFKETFGFDLSQKDDTFNYTEPEKLYPSFSNYWSCILSKGQPSP
jgi:transcriptional regulator with PAS, ATPase and Fis domain